MGSPSVTSRESASETVLRSRLLPRVSFQSLLILTAISAVVIAVVYAADQGGVYAAAAAAGALFAGSVLLVSAMVFLLSWAVSFLPTLVGGGLVALSVALLAGRLFSFSLGPLDFLSGAAWLFGLQLVGWYLVLARIGDDRRATTESPFAEEQLPPQIFAPRDPTN